MANQLTEQQVLNKLGIPDFRHLSKNNVMQFASILNEMDPAVAVKALEQFPDFAEVCKDALSKYDTVLEKTVDSNNESMKEVYESYKTIMTVLTKCAEKEDMPFEERKYYLEQMKYIADQVAKKDKENKEFILKIAGVAGTAVLGVVGICVALLGGKTNINLPIKK